MDLVQGNPLRSAAKQRQTRSAEQPAARSREGQRGNTYLLRQHPCKPAWDGKPKAKIVDHDRYLGRQPFTSPSRLVKCRPVA
jgi:hypothetical protein